MKTLIVVGHPDLRSSVVSKAWLEAIRPYESELLRVHVLSEVVRADGSFDVASEQELLSGFDRIVLQFPVYWYMPPAIMKNWMDTVWSEGWAWGEGGTQMKGKIIEGAASWGAPESVFTTPGAVTADQYTSFIQASASFIQANGGRCFHFYGAELPDAAARLAKNCESYIRFITEDED